MKANKRAALASQQIKAPKARASRAPRPAAPASPVNRQAPVARGQLDNALAYYGAMAAHGKG